LGVPGARIGVACEWCRPEERGQYLVSMSAAGCAGGLTVWGRLSPVASWRVIRASHPGAGHRFAGWSLGL